MSIDLAEPHRLTAVADYLAARPDAEQLTAVCDLAALICDAPIAAINLIDASSQFTFTAFGAEPQICAKEDSMCATTLAYGEDVYLEDAGADPRFAHNPWVDGRIARVHLYAATVLRTPDGAVVGTLCVLDPATDRQQPSPYERERRQRVLASLGQQVVDIFELRLRSDVLAHANAELARSQEYLAAFAGQVAHDLKTPLTATLGFAEMLSDLPTVAADPVAAEYVGRCLSSSERMLKLIDGLLGYARLGGMLQREPVRLDEVLPDVLQDLGELAERGTVRWSGDTPVPADRLQLRALLQNLVCNALSYGRPDVPPEVAVSTADTPIGVELVVADNGCGIPADRREEVLQPMTRLRTDVPGTGIGLASCQRIVAAHGGILQLGDTVGGGTTVTVVFPR